MAEVSNKLLERRRDNDAWARMDRVSMAVRLWRRELITELATANDEKEIDLLHWEMMQCGKLFWRMERAWESIVQDHIKKNAQKGS